MSRQNSSLIDARLSPDRIDPATNKAIMDMFEDGFSLSDPKANFSEMNSKENQTAGNNTISEIKLQSQSRSNQMKKDIRLRKL